MIAAGLTPFGVHLAFWAAVTAWVAIMYIAWKVRVL